MMSVNLLRLLTSKESATASLWKTTAAEPPVQFAPVQKAPAPDGVFVTKSAPSLDKVDVSELGSQLTGKAAEIFGALDSKVRGHLENFVKSGMMTAKEVTLALTAEVVSGLNARFRAEAAPTHEQLRLRARGQDLAESGKAAAEEYARAAGVDQPRELFNHDDAERDASGSPSLQWKTDSKDEMLNILRGKYLPGETEDGTDERTVLMQADWKISADRFRKLDLGFDMPNDGRIVSVEAGEAQGKMAELLLNVGGLADYGAYRAGMRSYVGSVDFSKAAGIA